MEAVKILFVQPAQGPNVQRASAVMDITAQVVMKHSYVIMERPVSRVMFLHATLNTLAQINLIVRIASYVKFDISL